MKQKLPRYVRNRFTMGLVAAGLLFLLLHAAIPLPARLSVLLEHIGLNILITTLVATVLNYYFESELRHAFSIVKGAEGAGICRIFAVRLPEAINRILAEAERSTWGIDLLCIAGTDFFLDPRNGLLKELERRWRTKSNIVVRILLLDPRSWEAIRRAMREEGDLGDVSTSKPYLDAQLPGHILTSIKNLESVLTAIRSTGPVESKGLKLTVRLYDESPKVMYVRTDDRVFVEAYLEGIPTDQRNCVVIKCLGKAVPVTEMFDDCEYARILKTHFNYLWENSGSREITPGSHHLIGNQLREVDWVARYAARQNEDHESLALPGEQLYNI